MDSMSYSVIVYEEIEIVLSLLISNTRNFTRYIRGYFSQVHPITLHSSTIKELKDVYREEINSKEDEENFKETCSHLLTILKNVSSICDNNIVYGDKELYIKINGECSERYNCSFIYDLVVSLNNGKEFYQELKTIYEKLNGKGETMNDKEKLNNLTFSEAYNYMLNGYKIKRPCFVGYWFINEEGKLTIHLKSGEEITQGDLDLTVRQTLANDWEVMM